MQNQASATPIHAAAAPAHPVISPDRAHMAREHGEENMARRDRSAVTARFCGHAIGLLSKAINHEYMPAGG
ncbi:hypothetical protein Pmar_PMAR014986 [Perkinsus marinus ATCC 50983]|uniref:Uncharacterized protein n=1 Tax=Perkinsus marinus (strain ATCC 50983 / TXsc) TaxID=423536 RepID=C5LVK9_PERM5|nr:hypothetical protein Pmar_PMAR014986 [Perkinsus marinus ATCC 50983]EEQ99233.1 hypothetical protein Pmar_PMAR014986 [Perkinsus marinus ATCC 50983]|eukprot:XP_002766516.1 hypothetical protein Pmar_PMAR014986 [Perkinsus marinus ATCC 50983]